MLTHRTPHPGMQAIKDWFIGGPNAYGTLTSLIAVAFCFIFPKDPAETGVPATRAWSVALGLRRGSSIFARGSSIFGRRPSVVAGQANGNGSTISLDVAPGDDKA